MKSTSDMAISGDRDIEVRKPPISAVLVLHKQGVRGTCGWCGDAVTEKTPARGWFLFWHPKCSREMGIIEQPALARDAVFERDKGICAQCKEDWSNAAQLIPEFYVSAWREAHFDEDTSTPGPDGKRRVQVHTIDGFKYVSLKSISLWHVDHRIPLWSVVHMPALQRIEYFKLANLQTLCDPCHKQKTKREAARKSKFDGQAELFDAPAQPKPKSGFGSRPMKSGKTTWPKRKIENRGFQKRGKT